MTLEGLESGNAENRLQACNQLASTVKNPTQAAEVLNELVQGLWSPVHMHRWGCFVSLGGFLSQNKANSYQLHSFIEKMQYRQKKNTSVDALAFLLAYGALAASFQVNDSILKLCNNDELHQPGQAILQQVLDSISSQAVADIAINVICLWILNCTCEQTRQKILESIAVILKQRKGLNEAQLWMRLYTLNSTGILNRGLELLPHFELETLVKFHSQAIILPQKAINYCSTFLHYIWNRGCVLSRENWRQVWGSLDAMSAPLELVANAHQNKIASAAHQNKIASAAHQNNIASAAHQNKIASAAHPNNIASAAHPNNIASAAHPNNIASAAHPNNIASAAHPNKILPLQLRHSIALCWALISPNTAKLKIPDYNPVLEMLISSPNLAQTVFTMFHENNNHEGIDKLFLNLLGAALCRNYGSVKQLIPLTFTKMGSNSLLTLDPTDWGMFNFFESAILYGSSHDPNTFTLKTKSFLQDDPLKVDDDFIRLKQSQISQLIELWGCYAKTIFQNPFSPPRKTCRCANFLYRLRGIQPAAVAEIVMQLFQTFPTCPHKILWLTQVLLLCPEIGWRRPDLIIDLFATILLDSEPSTLISQRVQAALVIDESKHYRDRLIHLLSNAFRTLEKKALKLTFDRETLSYKVNESYDPTLACYFSIPLGSGVEICETKPENHDLRLVCNCAQLLALYQPQKLKAWTKLGAVLDPCKPALKAARRIIRAYIDDELVSNRLSAATLEHAWACISPRLSTTQVCQLLFKPASCESASGRSHLSRTFHVKTRLLHLLPRLLSPPTLPFLLTILHYVHQKRPIKNPPFSQTRYIRHLLQTALSLAHRLTPELSEDINNEIKHLLKARWPLPPNQRPLLDKIIIALLPTLVLQSPTQTIVEFAVTRGGSHAFLAPSFWKLYAAHLKANSLFPTLNLALLFETPLDPRSAIALLDIADFTTRKNLHTLLFPGYSTSKLAAESANLAQKTALSLLPACKTFALNLVLKYSIALIRRQNNNSTVRQISQTIAQTTVENLNPRTRKLAQNLAALSCAKKSSSSEPTHSKRMRNI